MENFDFAKGEFKERPPEEITAGERFWRAASDSKLDEVRAQTAELHSPGGTLGKMISAIGRGRLGRGVGVGLEFLPLLFACDHRFLTSKALLTACNPLAGPSAG